MYGAGARRGSAASRIGAKGVHGSIKTAFSIGGKPSAAYPANRHQWHLAASNMAAWHVTASIAAQHHRGVTRHAAWRHGEQTLNGGGAQ